MKRANSLACGRRRFSPDAVSRTPEALMPAAAGGKRKTPKRNGIYDTVALKLLVNGYVPVPLSGKEPLIKGWQELFCEQKLTEDDVRSRGVGYRGVVLDGVGIACNAGLIVIDIDMNELAVLERLRRILPWVDDAPACQGRRGPKLFCRAADGQNRKEWAISSQSTGGVLEVLTWHRQAVVPPTVHPVTKAAYVWRDDSCTLLTTPLNELPVIAEAQVEAIRAEFGVKTIRAKAKRKATEHAKAERDAAEGAKTWDRDPEELRRYAVALTFLDADDRDRWLRVCWALKRYTRGGLDGRQLWDAWSGGGLFRGVQFRGSAKFNLTETQEEIWTEADTGVKGEKPLTMGSLIHEARLRGFDARLAQWPTLRAKYARKAEVAQATGKIAVAAAATPKGGLFIEAKDALRARANIDPRLANRERVILNLVLRFINHDHGFAWVGYGRLAEGVNMSVRAVQDAVTCIAAAGYLVRVTNHRNPDGWIGVAFAMVPPDDMTWADLIERDRIAIGHDEGTARLPDADFYSQMATSDHVDPSQSEPPPEPNGVGRTQENDDWGRGTPLDVPPPDCDGWVHDSTGDTTYRDRSRNGGVSSDSFDAGSTARTLEDWLSSDAVPEEVVERCLAAKQKGIGGKALTLLAQKHDLARSNGMTDTEIHLLSQDAMSRVTYRGKEQPPINLGDIAPGKCLSMLLEKFILLLGDRGIQTPEYPAMKRRAEEAKARRRASPQTRPTTNAYAEAHGKRDPSLYASTAPADRRPGSR